MELGNSYMNSAIRDTSAALKHFHPCTQTWFEEVFDAPTKVQTEAWPAIANGESTLLLAPTGSGKTLAAFLAAIDRIMFGQNYQQFENSVRVLYISPLKALGVDVDRNLKSPIAGLRTVAERDGHDVHIPRVAVRSGDTSEKERLLIARNPPEILIITPESLYLILTSKAREILHNVETVIIDEIHALAPTKRGTHLFLSLERLEYLRKQQDNNIQPLQRIGLSATQRPLEEIATLLGGFDIDNTSDAVPQPRPVNIINASEPKQFRLKVEVPVEDMTQLGDPIPSGAASGPPAPPSIWPSIHPRLVELVRQHRSTMIFVNSRRLAERLATAINDLAEDEIAQAHHGSISKQTRELIEDRLKRGELPAIVATSSLELGLDMGAVDLVIQIEAPPSIASGIQRIGRSGHQIGEPSTGVIFPKYRGDLLSCSAATGRMMAGHVEETHYPRNPLDVLAQQIVAITALESMHIDETYSLVRQAAPYAELPRSSFEGVLDLLSGRYPSNEFSELRPRINWDRIAGTISPRKGSQRLAILNGGTIADRGLYGVFLATEDGQNRSRVGELDEEMVFETKPGDVFLLGASSWRVMDITRDQVLVTPAPGEPGRMPFWKGESVGRPLEFGKAIGELSAELAKTSRKRALKKLQDEHALDELAAGNLMDYLRDQTEATEELPSHNMIIIESFLDEVGDWRIVVLSPFGSRVHAPWSMAVLSQLRNAGFEDIDSMWADDGMVFRIPDTGELPPKDLFLPRSDEVEEIVISQVGSSALFAARFRENAARALLLPRRQPNRRTPLWLQRRKSADLLKVASRYKSFPILIETYRECLSDVFDLPGLREILQSVEQRRIRVKAVQSAKPSPFAGSLLFNYTANFIYDGDAPLAERRAQALALDHGQLRALLGSADYRELLDTEIVEAVEAELQKTANPYANHIDDVHHLLLRLGELTVEELLMRCLPGTTMDQCEDWLQDLLKQRRAFKMKLGAEVRYVAAEDAGRYRDALGIVIPPGIPDAFLEEVVDPLADIVLRYARTHGPFRLAKLATRYAIGEAPLRTCLSALTQNDRLVEGEFLPGKRGTEWCDTDVLRTIKRRSLARLRQQVEPVDQQTLAQFLPDWQSVTRPRKGLDGVLDVIEQLQGLPLPASEWEESILPARVHNFQKSDLDELCAAGEIIWRGVESIGSTDGRIAIYLADNYQTLCSTPENDDNELSSRIRDLLAKQGALFFEQIHGVLGGFQNDLFETLWKLVWAGEVTNDTLAPLRSLRRSSTQQKRTSRSRDRSRFRSRRQAKTPGSEGRWSQLESHRHQDVSATERQSAIASQLIARYGILTREMVSSENLTGGFSAVYPVLKAMEEAGRIRRGYFVAGMGAAQFAAAGADDQIRHLSDLTKADKEAESEVLMLAATDPANPYGLVLKWPELPEEISTRPQRTVGARVFLKNGKLLGYLTRNQQHLLSFLPRVEPDRSEYREELIESFLKMQLIGTSMLLAKIDGKPPGETEFGELLTKSGFRASSNGYIKPRRHV